MRRTELNPRAMGVLAIVALVYIGSKYQAPPVQPSDAVPSPAAPVVASAPPPARPVLDLAKPVYLAEDAVECARLAVMGAAMGAMQAGGKAAGPRATAELFVHPVEGCLRNLERKRVRVVDNAITADILVTIECNSGYDPRCYVRSGDLSN